MLVLSRKLGEKVVIDGGITITVVEVNGGRMKMGIDAPANVGILRGELVAKEERSCLEAYSGAEQVGANHARGLQRTPITVAAIKDDPLKRLRKVPR